MHDWAMNNVNNNIPCQQRHTTVAPPLVAGGGGVAESAQLCIFINLRCLYSRLLKGIRTSTLGFNIN